MMQMLVGCKERLTREDGWWGGELGWLTALVSLFLHYVYSPSIFIQTVSKKFYKFGSPSHALSWGRVGCMLRSTAASQANPI